MKKVADLQVGEEFKYGDTTLIVRTVDGANHKVLAAKRAASFPHGCISLSFYSPDHDDLMRRVEVVATQEI